MKILMTGFDPFGGEKINPSWEAVKRCGREDVTIVRAEIPTSYIRGPERLRALCVEHRPDVVLCVGQAGGRRGVTVERVAINVMEASQADNDGMLANNMPIDPAGQAAYFATLPIHRMVEALRAQGLEASISNTAGTFVCNRVMYEALRLADQEYPGMRSGFVHLPFLPEQAEGKTQGTPTMPLEEMVRALNGMLDVLKEEQTC